MINDSYDTSRPFLEAERIFKNAKENDVVTLVTFSQAVVKYVIGKYHATMCLQYPTTNSTQEVYTFNLEGKDYFIYMTGIGAAMAGATLNEVKVMTGSHKYIYFGSCGVLNENKCRGKIIVPTEAYRDEGLSYHYLPASDYVEIRNAPKLIDILSQLDIPFVSGRTWTTDAIYMETINKVNLHKKAGCLTVEMEVSGIEAISRYLNVDNYHLLFPADSLDSNDIWDKVDFGGDNELALQIKSFEIALLVAKHL